MKENIRKYLLLSLFLILASLALQGNERVLPRDNTPLKLRAPQERKIEEYRHDSNFRYTRKRVNFSVWDRFKFWLAEKLAGLFQFVGNAGWIELVILLVITLTIVFLILKMSGLNLNTLFSATPKSITTDYIVEGENLAVMDLPSLIEEAETNKNYRLAIRYNYLHTLKQLAIAGILELKDEKLNRQYLFELTSENMRSDFSTLLNRFEYVWYGGFAPDATQYQRIRNDFQSFQNNLNA
jgi:hypothetical protein